MVADIHIEDFYKDVAKILIHLHHYFPRKSQVFVEDICGPDTPDEFGLHSPRHQSCFSAMLWLADEGYIRFEDTIRQEAIDQVVLTQKTFIRLNRLSHFPEKQVSAGEPTTNIHVIRTTLKNETSTKLAMILGSILFES